MTTERAITPDLEPQWLWRMKLTYWMLRFRYQANPLRAWKWTGEECWTDYWRDGYSARDAIAEDMSYGD